MKRSLNELCGMVLKAARGAGVPLGHCEDLAAVAGYLAATDAVALECLRDALAGPFDGVLGQSADGQLRITQGAVVMVGPYCVDGFQAGCTQIQIDNCPEPRLIFAYCAAAGLGVSHEFDGDTLILTRVDEAPAVPAAAPVTVAQSLWEYLNGLASKTYVPATEASRLAGAGAGLTDND